MNDTLETWRTGMAAVQAESAGVMRLYIINPTDAVELLSAALCGDAEAARLFRAVTDTVERIAQAPARRPMLCGNCPSPLKSPRFCVGIAMPERDDPTQAIGFAFCLRCSRKASSPDDLALRVLKRIWPDGRMITITDRAGGHA